MSSLVAADGSGGGTKGPEGKRFCLARFPECAVEPDSELPADLQGSQRLAVISFILMRGSIAGDTQVMEQFANLLGDHALELQAPDDVRLTFLNIPKHTGLRSG